MDLAQRFEWVACEKKISVTELGLNRKYRILLAKRLTTIFGPNVVLTIRGEGAAPARIFLPREYSDFITDNSAMFGGCCGTITRQTVWSYLAQIHFTCLVVAMSRWRVCLPTLVRYIVRFTGHLFRKTDYHDIETKTSQRHTIKLVCYKLFMCLSLSSIVKLSHW